MTKPPLRETQTWQRGVRTAFPLPTRPLVWTLAAAAVAAPWALQVIR